MSGQRCVVISADTHCGADLVGYKTYLEHRYHADFDEWLSSYEDPWGALDDDAGDHRVGVSSFLADVNWDSQKRVGQLEAEGIVAEVLFPNTTPPFFPSGAVSAAAPGRPPNSRRDYELRFAGLRAHNRWVADFVRELPGRRAGLAQVFLSDVDDTIDEVQRARDDGLAGVLLPPDHFQQLQNLYYPEYDRLWAVCADLGMCVGRHGVIVGEANSPGSGQFSASIGLLESFYFAQRPLIAMLVSGVFERHPGLKFVITELGCSWVPALVANLDGYLDDARKPGTISHMFGSDALRALPKKPSEYLASNCYFGSFFTVADIESRNWVGTTNMMWGADYPHHEGTSPHTLKALRLNFAGLRGEETQRILAKNAANVYGFDMKLLQTVADRIGPSVEELNRPLTRAEFPSYPEDTVCATFVTSAVPAPTIDRGHNLDVASLSEL
jgi:predicted TIM-barrel fold metal-dependent hydrolase